jgi:SprT-like family
MPPISQPVRTLDTSARRTLFTIPWLVVVLTACHATGATPTIKADTHILAAYRSTALGNVHAMPIEEDNPTKPRALHRLANALDRAYKAYDLVPPLPSIKIVSPRHDLMRHSRVGMAAVTASGKELIYFNRAHLETRKSIEPLVMHEVAHLKAWRIHGHAIKSHGKEYKAVCRAVTDRKNCTRLE